MSKTFRMLRSILITRQRAAPILSNSPDLLVTFVLLRPVQSPEEGLKRLQSDDISLILEIPPSFGRDFRRGNEPEVLAQVDGAITFRGETISQYAQGVHNRMLHDPASGLYSGPPKYTANIPRAVHVQSHVRKHLLDRAERTVTAAAPDTGNSYGDQHCARKRTGLDDQLLRHADQEGWNTSSENNFLTLRLAC